MRNLFVVLVLSFMSACGGSSDDTSNPAKLIPGLGTPAKISAVPAN